MPDQNAAALPFGCTGETQTDICTDEDQTIYNAGELYRATPPGGDGGRDIRDSLKVIISRGPKDMRGTLGPKRLAYFNIRALSPLDWFDALRLALISTADEKRSISLGTPWFPSWEDTAQNGQYVLPMPTDLELQTIRRETGIFGFIHRPKHKIQRSFGAAIPQINWHNHKSPGFHTENNAPVLRSKSWQGTKVGRNGWLAFNREVTNVVMSLKGTGAFTVTRLSTPNINIVNLDWISTIVSYIRQLLGLQ